MKPVTHQSDDSHPGGDQELKYYEDLLCLNSGPEELQNLQDLPGGEYELTTSKPF